MNFSQRTSCNQTTEETEMKTSRMVTLSLYVIVSNYSAVVGIHMVTCLTLRNNSKFVHVSQDA
jgi:hypothetical protein